MRVLLDTHVLLWALEDSPRLSPGSRETIREANEVFVSSATMWEIVIKKARGKLEVDDGLADAVTASGFVELPITWRHALAVETLPDHHRDPFDRMLVAQARWEELTLMTHDAKVRRYDVDLLAV